MFRTLLGPAPCSSTFSTPTSSSAFPPEQDKSLCTVIRSPLAGYEPNAPVEVTEVMMTLLPSRNASIGSTYNSSEDIVTTLDVSDVDQRSDFGILASLQLTQERPTSATPFRIYHSSGEF